jgi:hypothetical protein
MMRSLHDLSKLHPAVVTYSGTNRSNKQNLIDETRADLQRPMSKGNRLNHHGLLALLVLIMLLAF